MNDKVEGLNYGRIADLLVEQLATDGHSLNNIPQAVFHIQAHGLDDNRIRLTYPGIPLFPTRALAMVGYNTHGLMSYCPRDFNEYVTIKDTTGNSYAITIHVKSDAPVHAPVQLPPGKTISEKQGRELGFISDETRRLNEGKIVKKYVGSDGGKISIDQALGIATTKYYSFIKELRKEGVILDDANINQTLLKLQESMYHNCGISSFPNCRDRKMPGFYKDIFYVYEKRYALFENPGENTVCEITTEQGTHMEVRMPMPLTPYGLYIMYSTLDYLSVMAINVPTKIDKNPNPIIEKIRQIYGILFGSTSPTESNTDICISQANIMYNGRDLPGTYDNKVPELFHNIIKSQLNSPLFQALIPDVRIRNQIAKYWYELADMDTTDKKQYIPFSHLQFYLSYILLLDVSIIDGSCRISQTKSALISPSFFSEVARKSTTSRKSALAIQPVLSNPRLLLQNKTADIISTVTTDIINKRIAKFRESSSIEEQRQSIYKWIHIFNKSSFQEMLNSLRSPWFNYTPISIDPSHLNTFAISAMKPEETKKAIEKMEEEEKKQEIAERQQEFLDYIEEEKKQEIAERQQEFLDYIEKELVTRINDFLPDNELEKTYPDIKREILEVIINRTFLDPSDISDEEIQSIIDNIITTNLQITQKARGRTSRQTTTLPFPGLKTHRDRKESEYPDSGRNPKTLRDGTSSRMKGGKYKPRRKTVRRNNKTRKQKVTKNKRKLTRKQY
jgi:hypothetical protein